MKTSGIVVRVEGFEPSDILSLKHNNLLSSAFQYHISHMSVLTAEKANEKRFIKSSPLNLNSTFEPLFNSFEMVNDMLENIMVAIYTSFL